MLSRHVDRDRLSPHDALSNRWGRGQFYDHIVSLDAEEYLDLEDPALQSSNNQELIGDLEAAFRELTEIEQLPSPPVSKSAFAALSEFRYDSSVSGRSSSSWSMRSAFTSFTQPSPSLSRKSSWTSLLRRPSSIRSSTPVSFVLANKAKELPHEILICILQHLRDIHEQPPSTSCSSCFNNDAFNLALVSRAWDKAVRAELYRCIHLDGGDVFSRRAGQKSFTRLKLLRRTLRHRGNLARGVQELRIWDPHSNLKDDVLDEIATVIMACPNLMRFTGSQPFYTHEWSRFQHALSSRKKLQSHLWVLGADSKSKQELSLNFRDQFLDFHESWENLTTLAFRCQRGASLDANILTTALHMLPALSKLSISGFSAESFDDSTLLELPALCALRLADLPGVTDKGLSRFSILPHMQRLDSLTLISLRISSLYTISRLLSNLSLSKFTLTQYIPLSLPAEDLIFQPLLASRTLKRLHWEIPLSESELSLASFHLSESILHNGFPRLTSLRYPSDTNEGAFQSLCKPLPQPDVSIRLPCSQISGTTLRATKLRSQSRICAAVRGEIGTGILLQASDPDDDIFEEEDITWLGYVGYDRNIQYDLSSDIGVWEHRKTLAEEGDMLGDFSDYGLTCQSKRRDGRQSSGVRWRGVDIEALF